MVVLSRAMWIGCGGGCDGAFSIRLRISVNMQLAVVLYHSPCWIRFCTIFFFFLLFIYLVALNVSWCTTVWIKNIIIIITGIINRAAMRRTKRQKTLMPQSHRIVRFLGRTIGCDLANVRPIGNVCYDLQILRSVFFAGGRSSYDWSYAWSRDQQRLEKIDGKIHHIVGNRTTSGSHKRTIVRSIVAPDDRSYDQSRNSATETSPHYIMSVSNRFVVPPVVRWHDQFWTWPSTLLRLICPLRSPTTTATSRTFFLRLSHDSNIFRSQEVVTWS